MFCCYLLIRDHTANQSINRSCRAWRLCFENIWCTAYDKIYGVPQESILGPLLFSFYMLVPGQIIYKRCSALHIQLHIKHYYLDDKNFLKHNKDKTETIFIGKTIKTKWGNLATRIKPIVRKLGVFVDSGFTLNHTLLLVQHSFICWTPVKPLRCWHMLLFASFITHKRELITSIQGTLD